MSRSILAALVLVLLSLTGAYACDGQVGNVIFDDDFSDDSGGWQLTPGVDTIKPSEMDIALSSKAQNESALIALFNATDGDYCVQAVLPKAPAPDNAVYFGLAFWATDYSNYYLVQVSSAGTIAMYRKVQNVWSQVFVLPTPALKTEPDALNTLRVVAKDGKISVSLNGAVTKVVRAQTPTGALRFGIYAQIDKGVDGMPPVKIKSFKVTSG